MGVEPKQVAFIGTRFLNPVSPEADTLRYMGSFRAKRGDSILTGNAPGVDQIVADGVNKINEHLLELYLPWPSFEADKIKPGNIVHANYDYCFEWLIDSTGRMWSEYAEFRGLTGATVFTRLKQSTQRLMMRNFKLVYDAEQVLALPEFDVRGNPKGGTAFGIFVAERLGRPVKIIDFGKEYFSWDRCDKCNLPSSLWDCGQSRVHHLKPYADSVNVSLPNIIAGAG